MPIKVYLQAHQPLQLHSLLSVIIKSGTAADNVTGWIDIIIQFQCQFISGVHKADAKLLCFLFAAIGTRQFRKGFLTFGYLCFPVYKIYRIASIGIHHFHKRLSYISFSIGGHFKAHIL